VGKIGEQGFWIKYYPSGGDFFQNPKGLTLWNQLLALATHLDLLFSFFWTS